MKNPKEPRTPTQAQIDANRRNAQKSSGPRTGVPSGSGKAASSRGTLWVRLLHGLRANQHILLLDEDPEEFLILLKDLDNRFQPVGAGEEMLVLRIAADQWRLDRSLPMEAGIYRQRLEAVAAEDYTRKRGLVNHKRNHELNPALVPPPPAPPDEGDRLARAFTVDCERPNSLAKLARYESSIQRSIDRSLRQLQKYQAARRASNPDPGPQPSPPEREPLNPEAGPAVPSAVPPAPTPSKEGNYHSNPKNEGIARASAAPILFVMYAVLHALPALIAALGSLLTGPRIGHNRPKMNPLHPLAPVVSRIRQQLKGGHIVPAATF